MPPWPDTSSHSRRSALEDKDGASSYVGSANCASSQRRTIRRPDFGADLSGCRTTRQRLLGKGAIHAYARELLQPLKAVAAHRLVVVDEEPLPSRACSSRMRRYIACQTRSAPA